VFKIRVIRNYARICSASVRLRMRRGWQKSEVRISHAYGVQVQARFEVGHEDPKARREFNRGFRRTGETDLSVFFTAEGAKAAEAFVFDKNRYDKVYKHMRIYLYSDLRIRILGGGVCGLRVAGCGPREIGGCHLTG